MAKNITNPTKSKFVIYKADDGQTKVDVRFDNETVWITQQAMANLFKTTKQNISQHASNIFKEKELVENSVVKNFFTTASDNKKYSTIFYNLDMIISVGYRIKSKVATSFRQWATQRLREYIVEGYTINQKRLEQSREKYLELQAHIKTLSKVIENETFTLAQSKSLVRLISDYAGKLLLLDQIDKDTLKSPKNLTITKALPIKYNKAKEYIDKLRDKFKAGNLFGQEHDSRFESILKSIFQTFDKRDLYESIEEKAANLLYLVIKNHPFTDGNKRIGSFMFLTF